MKIQVLESKENKSHGDKADLKRLKDCRRKRKSRAQQSEESFEMERCNNRVEEIISLIKQERENFGTRIFSVKDYSMWILVGDKIFTGYLLLQDTERKKTSKGILIWHSEKEKNM